MTKHSNDPPEINAYISARLLGIKHRRATWRAMAESRLNTASTAAERMAAQRWLDRLDKLTADLNDGPPGAEESGAQP